MLVLARRQGESLGIGNNTKITVLNIDKEQVGLCIDDTEEATIHISENLIFGRPSNGKY